MDFVPMFWGTVPAQPLEGETHDNLLKARYLLTFNEPEIEMQSNILANEAAQLWPQIEAIAAQYNLEIVAPCTVGDKKGRVWYDEWLGNCTALFGSACSFDYTCVHLYYQPWDAAIGSCAPGVFSWACIGANAAKAVAQVDEWFTAYGNRPVWITEWACAPWGDGSGHCDVARHAALMEQMLPVLHNNPRVFRYSWYSAFEASWVDNSLNELVWQKYVGQVCPTKKWLKGFGHSGWEIQTLHQCVAAADADTACATPLALSVDDDSCHCATDACEDLGTTYTAMVTYKQVGPRNPSTLTPLGQYYNDYGVEAAEVDPTCLAAGEGLGCDGQTNCCSGMGSCTGGGGADSVCAAEVTCGDSKAQCTTGDDCCSGRCSGGKCRRSLKLSGLKRKQRRKRRKRDMKRKNE